MIENLLNNYSPTSSFNDVDIPLNLNGISIKLIGLIFSFNSVAKFRDIYSYIIVCRNWYYLGNNFSEDYIEIPPDVIEKFILFPYIPELNNNADNCSISIAKIISRKKDEPLFTVSIKMIYE